MPSELVADTLLVFSTPRPPPRAIISNAITNLNNALILPTGINRKAILQTPKIQSTTSIVHTSHSKETDDMRLRENICVHIDLELQLARNAVASTIHTLTTTAVA